MFCTINSTKNTFFIFFRFALVQCTCKKNTTIINQSGGNVMTYEIKKNYNYSEEELKLFNCMGYAFGVELMMNPATTLYVLEWMDEMYNIFNTNSLEVPDEISDWVADDCEDCLCDCYPGLELIKNPESVPEDKELISFKFAVNSLTNPSDYNFHFKVRRNGTWSEKLGDEEIRECELLPDESWDSRDFQNGVWSSVRYFAWKEELSREDINKVIIEQIDNRAVFSLHEKNRREGYDLQLHF